MKNNIEVIKCDSELEFKQIREIFFFKRKSRYGLKDTDFENKFYGIDGNGGFDKQSLDKLKSEGHEIIIIPASIFIENNKLDWSPKYGERIEVNYDDNWMYEEGDFVYFVSYIKQDIDSYYCVKNKEDMDKKDEYNVIKYTYARPVRRFTKLEAENMYGIEIIN